MIISPYPAEQETLIKLKTDQDLLIRPIRPEDADIYRSFFKSLSPTSIYFRFFSPIKEPSPDMLARFTQVDYDREIALVGLTGGYKNEQMLGVARVIGDPDGKIGEFSVLISDAWQGKGIGAALLNNCLKIARQRGFEKIIGLVLPENRNMITLAKKLGFVLFKDPDGEYELEMHLNQIPK